MTTRATRFAGPLVPAGGAGTALFTVPAGHRYLVRLLRVVNSSTTATQTILFYIGASTAGTAIARFDNVPVSSMASDTGWFVVDETETLTAIRSGGSVACSVMVNGYDLLL